MAPRKRKQNADEKALPEVTAAERAAVEKCRAKKKPEPNAAKPHDKMMSQERTASDKFLARNAANPAPRLKVLKGQAARIRISPDHANDLAGQMLPMDALGTGDLDFYHGLLIQLATASSKGGQVDEGRFNFMLSVVKGVQPRDQLEAMLAAQMVAVHMATMTIAQRLANVENIQQQDSAERAFNKLSRTFTTLMEALKRYRTGGEQKVTVQHVSVAEGGQAIVGNVTQAQRENVPGKAAASPPLALSNSNVVPMPTIDESKERALVAGRPKSTK
jgi:hypothetical protein